jgi:hypothetical protein
MENKKKVIRLIKAQQPFFINEEVPYNIRKFYDQGDISIIDLYWTLSSVNQQQIEFMQMRDAFRLLAYYLKHTKDTVQVI